MSDSYTQNHGLFYTLRALLCTLGGVPMRDEHGYKDALNLYGDHINTNVEDLNGYRRTIQTQDGKDTDIHWFEGLHGAYAIVDRDIPVSDGNGLYQTQAATALFSPHADKLLSALTGKAKDYKDIVTLPIHTHEDLLSAGNLSYSPIHKLIESHYADYKDRKNKNMLFHQDGDFVLRSETAVIYARPDKKSGGYNIMLYTNPSAEKGMPVTSALLEKRLFRGVLRLFAIQTNTQPIAKENLQSTLRTVAKQTADDYMVYAKPHRRYIKQAARGRKIRIGATALANTVLQPTAHLIALLDKPALMIGGVMAGVSAAAIPITMAAFGMLKTTGLAIFTITGLKALIVGNNPVAKGLKGLNRFLTKTLKRNKTNTVSHHYDHAPEFSTVQKVLDIWERKHFPMTDAFFQGIRPTSIQKTTAYDIPPYTTDIQNEWTQARAKAVDGFTGACFMRLDAEQTTLHCETMDGQRFEYQKTKHPETIQRTPTNGQALEIFPDKQKKQKRKKLAKEKNRKRSERDTEIKERFRRAHNDDRSQPHQVRERATMMMRTLRL